MTIYVRCELFKKIIHSKICLIIFLGSSVFLSIPPIRSLIEHSMFWQMVIQIPMLIVSGFWIAVMFSNSNPDIMQDIQYAKGWNLYGLPCFFVVTIILIYWMIPLNIDHAVLIYYFDTIKVISLLLCGFCLFISLQQAPLVLQLFFLGYLFAMMVWLGIYFLTTDLRLCNVYSLESQTHAGYGILLLSSSLLGIWGVVAYQHSLK